MRILLTTSYRNEATNAPEMTTSTQLNYCMEFYYAGNMEFVGVNPTFMSVVQISRLASRKYPLVVNVGCYTCSLRANGNYDCVAMAARVGRQ